MKEGLWGKNNYKEIRKKAEGGYSNFIAMGQAIDIDKIVSNAMISLDSMLIDP
jgi:hypothetical protein